ncbi:hypothetical protein [Staphylococcus pseudintermedius]|uniref:hypothetical protein n=1 Tax=Staphylococcus pseudintermedius TaxID=283734 RepID=UPI0018F2E114|nr:hypothetical protein [Staphylococcus pseudintermedius]MBJ8281744.1 hypothetical protein [Staphylococcus pseudintermedius]
MLKSFITASALLFLPLTQTPQTELTNSKTEFILYCELFNELIKPLFQKIKNVHGEDIESEIIFNYFAIEKNKFYLAFYEPILYVDLEDYLNNTKTMIEKLVEETEK